MKHNKLLKITAECFFAFLLLFSGCENLFMKAILGESQYKGPPGSGTVIDPFIVHNVETLKRVGTGEGISEIDNPAYGWTLDKHYLQVRNITLPPPEPGNGNWKPIGSFSDPFTGSFNGEGKDHKGRTISGLKINITDSYQGMFGSIANPGTVKNVTLTNISIDINGSYAGGIAGYNDGGTIERCKISGSIAGNSYIGGIAGIQSSINSNIQSCSFSGDIAGTALSSSNIGGITGNNENGLVQSCSVNGNFYGIALIGGIAGKNTGSLENCSALGTINAGNDAGGIAGSNEHKVQGCSARVYINGSSDMVGGVAGSNYGGSIENCYSTENIFGGNNSGGVTGYNTGIIEDCHSEGDITGNGNSVGGVAGRNNLGIVQNCYARGTVYGEITDVGGVVGYNEGNGVNTLGIISNCSYDGSIVIGMDERSGGVVGNNYQGLVQNCYSKGSITGMSDCTGGIAGYNNGTIKNCYYAQGIVNGMGNYSGGIAGLNYLGNISNCYAAGNIYGELDYVGGIAGANNQSGLNNCVALNSDIHSLGTSFYGRITGADISSILTNNYANKDILKDGKVFAWINIAHNYIDGADIQSDDYENPDFWLGEGSYLYYWLSEWDIDRTPLSLWFWDTNLNLPNLRNCGP